MCLFSKSARFRCVSVSGQSTSENIITHKHYCIVCLCIYANIQQGLMCNMYRWYSSQEHLFIWSNKKASSQLVISATRATTMYLPQMWSIIIGLDFRRKKMEQNSSDFSKLSYYQILALTNYDVFRSLKNDLTGKKTVSN